ncbi:MAG: hypothetical protein JW708_01540, partial [Vallitaleaceae bacterium]|nr:hypothetical protein [Vallitaleaceae bacterium]
MNTSTLKFITGILNDTLRIDFHYYLYPYHDLATFDRGFRNSLEDSEQHHQDFLQRIQTLHPETIYLYTDSYSLNYAILLPYAEKKDLIVVGPYFENPIDQTYWNQITLQHHLTLRHIDNLKGFLYSIPVIDNNLTVISTITDILTYINPESEAFSLEYIGSSSIDKSIASD